MATRIIIFVHREQSPGDSGDPLASIVQHENGVTCEILHTGEKTEHESFAYAIEDLLTNRDPAL